MPKNPPKTQDRAAAPGVTHRQSQQAAREQGRASQQSSPVPCPWAPRQPSEGLRRTGRASQVSGHAHPPTWAALPSPGQVCRPPARQLPPLTRGAPKGRDRTTYLPSPRLSTSDWVCPGWVLHTHTWEALTPPGSPLLPVSGRSPCTVQRGSVGTQPHFPLFSCSL